MAASFDGHLGERGGLVPRQCRKVEFAIHTHVIGHVDAGDLAQLVDHPFLGLFLDRLVDRFAEEQRPLDNARAQ